MSHNHGLTGRAGHVVPAQSLAAGFPHIPGTRSHLDLNTAHSPRDTNTDISIAGDSINDISIAGDTINDISIAGDTINDISFAGDTITDITSALQVTLSLTSHQHCR